VCVCVCVYVLLRPKANIKKNFGVARFFLLLKLQNLELHNNVPFPLFTLLLVMVVVVLVITAVQEKKKKKK